MIAEFLTILLMVSDSPSTGGFLARVSASDDLGPAIVRDRPLSAGDQGATRRFSGCYRLSLPSRPLGRDRDHLDVLLSLNAGRVQPRPVAFFDPPSPIETVWTV